jgi:predicted NAD/FAD-binding protein
VTSGPTRRTFLKVGSAAAVSLSFPGSARRLLPGARPRVGIVGGGLAGVACAWLLDGVADTVLFESGAALGGHAQTIPVVVGNQEIAVDVGAQFFAPGTHPTYEKLLEVLGLLDPAHPDEDATIEANMTIALTETGMQRPRFVSPSSGREWLLLAPWNRAALWAFLVFALSARKFGQDGDWLVSLGEWLQDLRVPAEQRERVLLPLVSAMVGCALERAPVLSARSALFFIANALPKKLGAPLLYSTSLRGLGGNVEYLARQSHDLIAHLGSPVTSVRPVEAGGYRIQSAAGICEQTDVVVFATPPYIAAPLLPDVSELAGAARLLEELQYFTADIVIHRDPVYMPPNGRYWSAYNANTDGGHCEGSIWYGALRSAPEGDAPLSLFKSWATARSEAPRDEVFRRTFRHPLITPAFIEGQRRLAAYQGRADVWFAGSYTKEVDSQETALTSAMNVVAHLAPQAPNLLRLQA